jgi:hypothetical protein
MICVSPASREAVDAWRIADAGFSHRVTHGLLRGNIQTLGQLRATPIESVRVLRNIGSGSVEEIERYLRTAAELERGELRFANIDELLDRFLRPREMGILRIRYRLDMPAGGFSDKLATLQSIALKQGITRERVRQVEEHARRVLGSLLAQACLAPLYGLFEGVLRSRHGICPGSELAGATPADDFAAHNPAQVLLLLTACGGRISERNGYFSMIPRLRLAEAEQEIRHLLTDCRTPVGIERIQEAATLAGFPPDDAGRRHVLQILLSNQPGICATTDDRYFIAERGVVAIAEEVLEKSDGAVHYRSLLRELNSRLRPGSRQGTGRLLRALLTSPAIDRTATGHYRLKEGIGK